VGLSPLSTSINSISPVARIINSDFVCVGQLNKMDLDILCEEYIKAGMTKDQFIDIYKSNTKDYSFLIINKNNSKTDDVNET
jgi:20S proteasome alpha/beta subunit